MRRSALLAGAALAAAIPASAQAGVAPARADYVPDHIWRDEDQAQLYERWFGDQLQAMGEPVLSRPGGLGRYRRRFRMLVLPNYQAGYAIRIDASQAGGRMRIVRLDGSGGYAPGRIARQRRLTLSVDDVRALDDMINGAGVAAMAAQAPSYEAPIPDPVTGETTIRLCHHATYFVFELVTDSGSRFVVRDSCDMPVGLRTLIDRLSEIRRDAGFR